MVNLHYNIMILGKEEEVERGLVEFLEQLGFIHGIFFQKRTNIICGIDFKLVHTNYSREGCLPER